MRENYSLLVILRISASGHVAELDYYLYDSWAVPSTTIDFTIGPVSY